MELDMEFELECKRIARERKGSLKKLEPEIQKTIPTMTLGGGISTIPAVVASHSDT